MIYDREDGVRVVEFGKGSVLVSPLDFPTTVSVGVCLTPTDPRGIGEKCDDHNGLTDGELGASVSMYFDKPESIDVVMEELATAKKALLLKQQGKEVDWPNL